MKKNESKILENDAFQYITDYPAYEKRLALYRQKIYKEGFDEGMEYFKALLEMHTNNLEDKQCIGEKKQRIEEETQRLREKTQRLREETQRLEEETQRIEEQKQLAEEKANYWENKQMQTIKKFLKRGDSLDEIADLYDLDKESLQQIIDKIDFT